MNPIFPVGTICFKKVVLILRFVFTKPIQFGPSKLIPYSAHFSTSAFSRSFPSSPISLKPAANNTTFFISRLYSSSSISSATSAGTARTARSIGFFILASVLCTSFPRTSPPLGFTKYRLPSNPCSIILLATR